MGLPTGRGGGRARESPMRHHLFEPLEPRQLLTGSFESALIGDATAVPPAGDVIPAAIVQPVVQSAAVIIADTMRN